MFDDYKKEVLNSYLEKKKTHQLSGNLESPTPKNLQKECLSVFSKRYSKKDDDILNLFFDPLNRINDHVLSIEKFELDKFRPLVKFLKEEIKDTREENVKLLAWLIGFASYKEWRVIKEGIKPDTTNPENIRNGSIDSPESELINGQTESTIQPSLSRRNIFITTIIILIVSGSSFLLWKDSLIERSSIISSNEKCMYWAGDHYEPSACDVVNKYVPIIPLNIKTLNHFKKINLPDTLTKNSLGKVWYYTSGKNREFFTDSGMHPVDTIKRLRPVTSYILTNYTSYYRFLLNRLVWSIGIIVFAIILAVLLNKYLPKHRSTKQK